MVALHQLLEVLQKIDIILDQVQVANTVFPLLNAALLLTPPSNKRRIWEGKSEINAATDAESRHYGMFTLC